MGYFIPGIMISQGYPNTRDEKGATFQAIQDATADGYIKAVQCLNVIDSKERGDIKKYIEANDIYLTYCLSRAVSDNKLNLSSLDEELREKSVRFVIDKAEEAKEIGSGVVQVISGKRPDSAHDRPKALAKLQQSLAEIAKAYKAYNIELVIEPLDYFADKKNTLGTTIEALELCEATDNLVLCLDTAHMLLNGEDIVHMTLIAKESAPEFHFCNCSRDKSSAFYGDRHLLISQKGDAEETQVLEWSKQLKNIGYFSKTKTPRLFFEINCELAKKAPSELTDYCITLFQRIENSLYTPE
jgi:sugar phosphate isomerase/epimerase